ncbi:MAG: DUF72 domain-containing protein [Candidatus Marinimicrobia bacterium]|nr:DUF72 domain-containing protein [Candidatus Neomarinimicrobiota bacterium]
MAGHVYIGTCSWKYPSWEGLVYDSRAPQNFLQEYARKYKSVEIDQWFWSLFGVDKIVLPKAEVVKEYVDSVPADFRFVVKAPNSLSLTHLYKHMSSGKLVENPHFLSPELYQTFLNSLSHMLPQIGAINLQFEYLNKLKMPVPQIFLERFVDFVKSIDKAVPLCIEIRNPNFLNSNYFQILSEHHVGHTFCHGYYMPDIQAVFERFSPLLQGTSIIRLLGADRQEIEKTTGKSWGRVVAPKDKEIPGIAAMVKKMVDQSGMDIYLNVNNHYEGSAPVTIGKLLHYLQN